MFTAQCRASRPRVPQRSSGARRITAGYASSAMLRRWTWCGSASASVRSAVAAAGASATSAAAAGMSQQLVSLIERGHGDLVAVRVLIRVTTALDRRLIIQLRWRAGDLERLLDSDHANLAATLVTRLREFDWDTRVETTYEAGRSTGSIDVLAWQPAMRSLLVIEIKTEVTSAEATFRKLDEKSRLATAIVRERFGWAPAAISRLLSVEDTSTNRRRVGGSEALFESALPTDGAEVRRWLREPRGALAGRLLLSPTNSGGGIRAVGGRHRVRRSRAAAALPAASVRRHVARELEAPGRPEPTILHG